MSDFAICVEHISKCYQIGVRRADSLSEQMAQAFSRSRPGDDAASTLWALNDVSFTVEHGDVLGIIGRNGSGKSTLLKILSRITKPTRGRAELHGRIGSLLEVGTGFHPELTGRENVFMNGAILGMKRVEIARKFDAIVEFSEIGQFLDTPVKRYSSGMYTRLAFAVAAHLDPDILVVDEVLAVGDAAFQRKCLGKMGEVAQEGRTVLFVSHNMGATRSLCNKTLLLNRGVLERFGPTQEVVSHYIRTLDARTAEQLQQASAQTSGAAITGFSVLDADGTATTEVRADQGMTFVYTIQCYEATLTEVNVQFTICDQDGYPLAHCNNLLTRRAIDLTAGSNVVQCTLDSLPLRTGVYLVNIALYRGQDQLSHVRHALSLGVTNPTFDQDVAMPTNFPPVVLRQAWTADTVERVCG